MPQLNTAQIVSHQWRNRLQTALLIGLLLGISSLAGSLLLGGLGIGIALGACLMALTVSPVARARWTLKLYRARPLTPQQAPDLYAILQMLAQRAQLPQTPQLYYLPTPLTNAFAVGSRQNAGIALTDGVLKTLTYPELAAVLSHETAHIAQDDLRVMGVADYVSRLTGVFALTGQILLLLAVPSLIFGDADIHWGPLLLLLASPQLALLVQLKLSRTREFNADAQAVALTGDPQTLINALRKLEQASHPWQAVLLPGWGNPEPSWLRTHPATEERIARLSDLPRQNTPHWPNWPTSTQHNLPDKCLKQRPRWYPTGLWH